MTSGVLLINLGSPDAPETGAVRRYLREFLMDPLVIDIPWVFRAPLVHAVIAPFRSPKSAEAYKKIWKTGESPLVAQSREFARKVQERLPNACVRLAMRYGKPSIKEALKDFKSAQVTDLTVLPLYPQYSTSATESSIRETARLIESVFKISPNVRIVRDFFDDAGFIDAWVGHARQDLKDRAVDHVLFSFHGLPERQVSPFEGTRDDYRTQCRATAKAIATGLDLKDGQYSMSYQSRLGRTPWIQPFTDIVLTELPKKGIRSLAVVCPGFVADNLETLEEIAMRGRESFLSAGGVEFHYVPSLNCDPEWIKAASDLCFGPRACKSPSTTR